MKSLQILLLVLVASATAHSQPTATVYGQIIDPADKAVYLRHYSNHISYDEVTVDSAELSKKGLFRMQFPWDTPGNLTFFHGDEITEMYVLPGDSIQLVLDTREFDESIRYSGRGALLNTYLAQKYLQAPVVTQERYHMHESVFAHYMDSISDRQLAFCDMYFQNTDQLTKAEQSFWELERQNIFYEAANEKLNYPMLHGYVTGKRGVYQPEPGYYSFLTEVPLVANNLTGSYPFLEFLVSYIRLEYVKRIGQDPAMDKSVLKRAIIDEKWQGYLRDFLYANWIYETLTENNDMSVAAALYATLKPSFETPAFTDFLEAAFAERALLAPGNPAPLFTVHDENGKAIELTQFRGKTVYLDIWATWCGPCLKEIPAMEKLIKEMADEDIVFLSVSVDADEKGWRKMIRDREMKGVHAISPGNFESQIARAYAVEGIPHYVIIDAAGKMFSANAPRPGDARAELQKCIAQ